jgi:hypothetical protein
VNWTPKSRPHRQRWWAFVLVALALLAFAPAAAALDGYEFTDFTSVDNNVATGTLVGQPISVSGTEISPTPFASNVAGTSPLLSDDYFTPPFPMSDVLHLVTSPSGGFTYTVQFAQPTQDPLIDFGSLGSEADFPAGISITRVSGSDGFSVSGSSVIGASPVPDPVDPSGENDSNGTVMLNGTFQSITFSLVNTQFLDGVYLEVGIAVPSPHTTISLDPGDLGPDGKPPRSVLAHVTASSPVGTSSLDTRCVLDPPAVPSGFDDLPQGCPYLAGATVVTNGPHTIYAGSRDPSGSTETPLVKRSFTVVSEPDTTITSGPDGDIFTTNPEFTFTSTFGDATFQCQLDTETWTSCATPFLTPTLALGPHAFAVRAVSPTGTADPTPAARRFTLDARATKEWSCEVKPVYFGVATLNFSHPDRYACEIGTLTSAGCASWDVCVSHAQVCPAGARCALTTKAQWFDDDQNFNWGAFAEAELAPAGDVDWYLNDPSSGEKPPPNEQACQTGFDGDRCSVQATLVALGNGQPMRSDCSASLTIGSGRLGVSSFGQDDIRRLECTADWTIAPAGLLATTLSTATLSTPAKLSVYVAGAGTLHTSGTLLLGRPSSLAREASKAKSTTPAIAPASVTVTEAGPAVVPVNLNRAARRLLHHRKRLPARFTTTFTQPGVAPITKTTRLTLTESGPPPTACRHQRRPKRGTTKPHCRPAEPSSLASPPIR